MEVIRAQINQFRSIKSMSISFNGKECSILLGINETGKSNILRALALLSRTERATPDDLRQIRHDEPEIERASVQFFLRTSEDDRTAFAAALHAKTRGLADTVLLHKNGEEFDFLRFASRFAGELSYTVDVAKNTRALQYFRYDDSDFSLGEDGWLVPSDACPAGHSVTLPRLGTVPLKSLSLFHTRDRSGDMPEAYLRAATAEDVQGLFMAAIVAAAQERLPECVAWSFSKDSVLPQSTNLEEFSRNPTAIPVLRNMFALAGFDDVGAALRDARQRTNGIRALLDRVGKRVSKELQELWTDKNVSVVLAENGAALEAAIQDTHGVFDFQRRSDGFRRFASFMLMVSSRARLGKLDGALLLYDEPDASLHPAAARQLRDELLRLAERCTVVYSTHSIFMVNPENVPSHYLVKRVNEETVIERAKPGNVRDEEVLYQAVGHTIFSDLKEMNLVVEGYRDRRLLDIAVSDPRAKPHGDAVSAFGRCHTRGVKNVSAVTAMLELVQRAYLIVTDGDPVALERRAAHGGGNWTTYPELLGDERVLTAEDLIELSKVNGALLAAAKGNEEIAGILPISIVEDSPVVRQIERALAARGGERQRQKDALNAVKERIFEGLTPADLRPTAARLVENIARRVERASSPSGRG